MTQNQRRRRRLRSVSARVVSAKDSRYTAGARAWKSGEETRLETDGVHLFLLLIPCA